MPYLDAIGWKATGLRNRIADQLWERRLGISTSGVKEIGRPDSYRYVSFAYPSLMKVLRHLRMASSDTFVDIGCGKGRVVCCASRLGAGQILGVEIDPELVEMARQNADRVRGRVSPVTIINSAAQDFDYRDCNVFFLFNPFGPDTLRGTVDAIVRSLLARPGACRLAYVNPLHEDVFGQAPGFEKLEHWRRRPWTGLKFDVSFWRFGSRD